MYKIINNTFNFLGGESFKPERISVFDIFKFNLDVLSQITLLSGISFVSTFDFSDQEVSKSLAGTTSSSASIPSSILSELDSVISKASVDPPTAMPHIVSYVSMRRYSWDQPIVEPTDSPTMNPTTLSVAGTILCIIIYT